MPPLQGLIFDLDGTLLDSEPDLRQALNLTLRAHGRRDVGSDEVKGFAGDGLLPMFHRAFALTGTPLADSESYVLFQEFIGHYRNQKPDPSQIYPHVRETLEFYCEAGVKLGVCTNKQEADTHRLLHDLNLKRYFTFIAGGDTFMTHKPHPDHVRGVVEGLGVLAEHCVMVGDGINDVRAAHGAGIPCIVVTHGYGLVEGLEADLFISHFKELPKAIEKVRVRPV